MDKKNRKQVIIGVTALLLVTLTLLGLTYAYYRTRIIGNTNEKSVSVTSKKLEVVYADGNGIITADKIEPGYTATKTFTVENNGDDTVSYSIKFDNITNTFRRTEDWTYSLKKGSSEVANGTIATGSHQILVGSTSIASSVTDSYTLEVTYANLTDVNQSEDMGKSLNLRVTIDEISNTWDTAVSGTLLYAIKNDNTVIDPVTIPGQQASTEAILSSTGDDYGTSYYYRGSVENNYVNFSGMCWRIVRVQGDGGIKITLADRDHECNSAEYSVANGNSAFITPIRQSFSYKYDYTNMPSDFVYADSDIPAVLNAWLNGGDYEYFDLQSTGHIQGTFTKKIDDSKLADTEWCNDMSIISNTSRDVFGNVLPDETEAVRTDLYCGAYGRLENRGTVSPSLKCNFTGMDNSKAERVTSKIGLLSADEVAFAGATTSTQGNVWNHYLKINATANGYWTLTPFKMCNGPACSDPYTFILSVRDSGYLIESPVFNTVDYGSIRPAVVLSSNSTITSGDGTQSNPYVIS